MSLNDLRARVAQRLGGTAAHEKTPPRVPTLAEPHLAMVLCAASAEACYHYVYYLTGGAPYTSVFAKFDLNALPDKTVTFLVADTDPATASSGS